MRKVIFLILILLCCSIHIRANAAEWIYYGVPGNESIQFYYDKTSIVHNPNKTVTVWTKKVFSEKGKRDELSRQLDEGWLMKGFENFSHYKVLYNLNCSTRESRLISGFAYDLNGNILQSVALSEVNQKWEPVIPESYGEALFNKVCNTGRKN